MEYINVYDFVVEKCEKRVEKMKYIINIVLRDIFLSLYVCNDNNDNNDNNYNTYMSICNS